MIRNFGGVTGLVSQPTGLDLGVGGGSNIKSSQRGELTLGALTTTTDVTISTVDLTKSIVKISVQSPNNVNLNQWTCYATLTSPTNLQFVIPTASGTTGLVSWEVIEFNNVKSLQSGLTSMTSLTMNVTISAVNLNKSILFFSNNSNATLIATHYFTLEGLLTASTNIKFSTLFANVITAKWYVIEFN
jgi:hypothetical protein